jgi:hypothetical protein
LGGFEKGKYNMDKLDNSRYSAIHKQVKGIGKSQKVRYLLLWSTGAVAYKTPWNTIHESNEREAIRVLLSYIGGDRIWKAVPIIRDEKDDPDHPLIAFVQRK